MKKLKKTKYSPKEIDLSLYPEYEEITGNALFLINGGKHILICLMIGTMIKMVS